MRTAEEAMVVLGLPCAVALWIDACIRIARRLRARHRVGSVPGPDDSGTGTGTCAPPRQTTPRGGGLR
jgi:hypothetical protein